MHNFKYSEGFVLRLNIDEYPAKYMIRSVRKDEVYLENIEDLEDTRLYSIEELELFKSRGELSCLAEDRQFGETTFRNLSEDEQTETTTRRLFVEGCRTPTGFTRSRSKVQLIIEEISKEYDVKSPPSSSSVISWTKKYIKGGEKLISLCPRKRFRGNTTFKLDDRIKEFIEEGRKLYFKKIRPSIASTVRHVQGLIVEHNLKNPDNPIKEPSYNALKYHITKSSAYFKTLKRKGKHKARTTYSYEHDYQKPVAILERVEIDHTPLDLHVVHDEHGTYLGRPNLTVLMDTYSSMVLGYVISFEPPSFIVAAMAIKHAILPKANSLFGDLWPAHGLPCLIVADNGAEFWGNNFHRTCEELGIPVQFAPVRSPTYKARVERFFGTVRSELIDTLPGQALPLSEHNSEHNPAKDASITLSELQNRFAHWLNKIYHRTPRGDNFDTPYEKWIASAQYTPIPEEGEKAITLKVLPSEPERTLDHEGIRIHNLIYKSYLLTDMWRRDGKNKIQVKYDPFDLGHIYVFDDLNKCYYKTPCKNFEYANGLSLFAHKKIRERLRSKSKANRQDDIVLQEGRAEFSAMTTEAHGRNKSRKLPISAKQHARATSEGVIKPSEALDEIANEVSQMEATGEQQANKPNVLTSDPSSFFGEDFKVETWEANL